DGVVVCLVGYEREVFIYIIYNKSKIRKKYLKWNYSSEAKGYLK
ncbi:hypothetical protein C5S31_02800, partial [ANME-1 cluster archaeon GoMg2]|nr:hypothetical protein [ANME-1 cluster archaeon GoMg2]